MNYIIRKKNSPYYIKDITQKVDGNFETLCWETSFTDVKDFIILKIKGKKERGSRLFIGCPAIFSAEFSGAFPHIFSELFMEIKTAVMGLRCAFALNPEGAKGAESRKRSGNGEKYGVLHSYVLFK